MELLALPSTIEHHPAEVRVIVDPLGGGAEALLELDAGADSVPLWSAASLGHLAVAALAAADPPATARVFVADLVNARPAAAQLARVLAPGSALLLSAACADGVFVAGVLVRTLLEELDAPAVLGDGAGLAIAVAGTATDLRAGLLMSTRGRVLDSDPGFVDRVAQLDLVGVLGEVVPSDGGPCLVAATSAPPD